MATIKYSVLKSWNNVKGNRVNKVLAIYNKIFCIFNIKCYEFQIPDTIRKRLNLNKRDNLIKITQIPIRDL